MEDDGYGEDNEDNDVVCGRDNVSCTAYKLVL